MPVYNYLSSSDWQQKISASQKILTSCTMCPRNCGVNRLDGQKGYCKSGFLPEISCITLHHGEEPVISGTNGAGNIFFSHCNLKCVFCQNHEISQVDNPIQNQVYQVEELADSMIELQNAGAHNIGLVSPTHFALQLIPVIKLASEKGLKIPIVYNSNGYDSVETLAILEGIIDIYLPDCKYGSDQAGKISGVADYFTKTKVALVEMYRQIGRRLNIYNGLADRGLIIRHLVLPNRLSCSKEIMQFIGEELSPDLHISLMSQYYPAHQAQSIDGLNQTISEQEYQEVIQIMAELGLENGWLQDIESEKCYRPEFNDRQKPFKLNRN